MGQNAGGLGVRSVCLPMCSGYSSQGQRNNHPTESAGVTSDGLPVAHRGTLMDQESSKRSDDKELDLNLLPRRERRPAVQHKQQMVPKAAISFTSEEVSFANSVQFPPFGSGISSSGWQEPLWEAHPS